MPGSTGNAGGGATPVCPAPGGRQRAGRRNIDRFPEDFMFELTKEEYENLRCQFGTLRWGAHSKYLPFAFTEQGVAMLSGVLSSQRAVMINIQIMRAFVRMRNLVADNADLRKAIRQIERRLDSHDQQIQVAFAALKSILQPKPAPPAPEQMPKKEYTSDDKKKMGFGKEPKKEPQAKNNRR